MVRITLTAGCLLLIGIRAVGCVCVACVVSKSGRLQVISLLRSVGGHLHTTPLETAHITSLICAQGDPVTLYSCLDADFWTVLFRNRFGPTGTTSARFPASTTPHTPCGVLNCVPISYQILILAIRF